MYNQKFEKFKVFSLRDRLDGFIINLSAVEAIPFRCSFSQRILCCGQILSAWGGDIHLRNGDEGPLTCDREITFTKPNLTLGGMQVSLTLLDLDARVASRPLLSNAPKYCRQFPLPGHGSHGTIMVSANATRATLRARAAAAGLNIHCEVRQMISRYIIDQRA